ncbi:MAG: hypothetical protein AAF702_13035 [Chloroflexota bacterium]
MDFSQTVDTHFSGAVREVAFIRNSFGTLSSYGFTSRNTIACVGVCRDELTRTFVDEVQKVWGEAFNFSGLGGLLSLGKTGLTAAHHHAPIEDGRERYVYYVLPHIAIDGSGKSGACYRPGRTEPSTACGALIAFRNQLIEGIKSVEVDWDDPEQSLLIRRLLPEMDTNNVPDLVTLTQVVQRVIVTDLERLIGLTINTDISDYAVCSGIQIHGPDQKQYVWPSTMYVVKNGQRTNVSQNELHNPHLKST